MFQQNLIENCSVISLWTLFFSKMPVRTLRLQLLSNLAKNTRIHIEISTESIEVFRVFEAAISLLPHDIDKNVDVYHGQ